MIDTTSTIENKNLCIPASGQETVSFGNGRYSRIAEELFDSSRFLLKLTDVQAEKVAKSFASELGRIDMKATSVKVGKLNKDGFVSLSEAAKIKGVKMTHALQVAKLVTILDDAVKCGVSTFDTITLDPDLVEWINS